MVDRLWDPLAGDGTDFDGEDVLVMRDEFGRLAVVPRALRNLDPELRQVVRGLQEAAEAVQAAQEAVAEGVSDARDQGLSWASIGWALGTTGEAARKRWGEPSE